MTALEAVLKQPSGGTESGTYFLAGPVYANGAVVAQYYQTLSRTTALVSVSSIDESIQTHTAGMNATPSTGQLTSAGFQIFSLSTSGPSVNARAGGLWTLQY